MNKSGQFGLFWACVGLILLAAACGRGSPPATREISTAASPPIAPFSFSDVTEEAGLGSFRHSTGAFGKRWFPESMGSGVGFLDYDEDGWHDILLVGGGDWPAHSDVAVDPVQSVKLYRNKGDGTYQDVTEESGLARIDAYAFGVAAADYDNDGDVDFFLTTLESNLLFRNDSGRFSEVGRQAGLAGAIEWSTSALFFDADRDGHVDLYVGNYVNWTPENDLACMLEGMIRSYCTPELYVGTPARFYHNNGDGTFSDWTERAGFLPAPGKTLGAVEYDLNRDGWPDLMVANDTQRDLLYFNNGDGTFTERGALSGMAYDENGKARAGMGIDAGVVDESGEPTLFVGNFSKEMISVFRHTGDGLFVDRASVSRIGRPSLLTLTFGLFLFDVDLDGDLDLFAANGHVQPEIERTQEGIAYHQPPHLFLNDGSGVFEDVVPQIGHALARPVVARGAAYADYDRDGDLDILLAENGGRAFLLRNDLPGGRSLRVDLVGSDSNRDGLSARLVCRAGDKRMERMVRTGSSFLSASEHTATFGLGKEERADSLVVYWPSGRVDHYRDVSAGAVIIQEGMPVPVNKAAVDYVNSRVGYTARW